MKAEDYQHFARGQRVMVQLKANMCMATEEDGDIAVAQVAEVPMEVWIAQISEAFTEQEKREPTFAELQELLKQNPVKKRVVMLPILICTLEVKGELLIGKYDYTEVRPGPGAHSMTSHKIAVETTLVPDDIAHVTVLGSRLLS